MRQLYILLLWLICITAKGQIFPYRYLSPFIISPSEDTNCMLFDKEGMMWLGTNAGLKSYDGYTVNIQVGCLLSRHPTQQQHSLYHRRPP